MLQAKYDRMAHELAYRHYMFDTSIDDKSRTFWKGACIAARQIIHAIQEEGEGYPLAFMSSETATHVVYSVFIGDYSAEVMIVK